MSPEQGSSLGPTRRFRQANDARVTKVRSGAIYRRTQFRGVRGEPSRLHSDLASISKARTGAGENSAAFRASASVETLFHPAVANWFADTFASPTPAQAEAWPAIKAGRHTLIAAPTGSGKTLAAFMSAIDDLVRQGLEGELPQATQVVYVSPLKALSNDIHRNLEAPLA